MEKLTEIEEYCYNLLYNNLSIKIFESWVYGSIELKGLLSDDDYLEIISINYRKEEKSKYETYNILKKYIDLGKIETKRILSLLYKSLKSRNDLPIVLMEIYHLYCNGYYFFNDIGLGYGLHCVVPPNNFKGDSWEKLTEQEKTALINSFFPDIIDDINRAIEWLENKKIILNGIENEKYIYTDMRNEEDC